MKMNGIIFFLTGRMNFPVSFLYKMLRKKNIVLNGKKACCYPGLEESLKGADIVYDAVTIDGNIITSRGLGTALDFALTILEQLTSTAKAAMIKKSVVA